MMCGIFEQVDFLTTLDKMILWSFIMLFATAVESFLVLVYLEDSPDTSEAFDRTSRYLFPAVYFSVLFFQVTTTLLCYSKATARSFDDDD
jgi:Na+/H+ antiporter NhaD/arsenite permease-like protein